MKVLGLDTTTYRGSIALYEDGQGLLAGINLLSPESHSRRLLTTLEWLLDRVNLRIADLDAIAVAAGPGSFTGVRIGLSTVKGLAEAAGLPAVGVHTLEAMALRAEKPAALVCPMLDAKRGEVYTALYRTDKNGLAGETLLAPAVITPDGFLPDLERSAGGAEVIFFGDGYLACADLLRDNSKIRSRTVSADDLFIGPQVARLGLESLRAGTCVTEPSGLSAIYIRPPDAELSARLRAAGKPNKAESDGHG